MSSFARIKPNADLDEKQKAEEIIAALHAKGVLPSTNYSEDRFDSLRAAVREKFEIPWTSITPPMERLLYAIGATRKPKHVVAIGVFCGNTLIWNVGPACGPGKCYEAETLVGVEIEEEHTALARRNFEEIGAADAVEILAADGHAVIDAIEYPIDLLYLDANGALPGTDGPNTKRIYLSLLERAYEKIPKGGVVLAHDTAPDWFIRDAGVYLDFVRDGKNFAASFSLEPDSEGLELSLK